MRKMEGYVVIKKDGTRENFDVTKVAKAVNKSAYRAMVEFTPQEIQFICSFVELLLFPFLLFYNFELSYPNSFCFLVRYNR